MRVSKRLSRPRENSHVEMWRLQDRIGSRYRSGLNRMKAIPAVGVAARASETMKMRIEHLFLRILRMVVAAFGVSLP